MNIANIIVGIILLLLGRKIYFLFVAGIGFIVGVYYAQNYLINLTPMLVIFFGLVIGFIGTLIALFAQNISLVIAGALSGMYIAQVLATYIPFNFGSQGWALWVIGAIVGAGLMIVFFDWAIITLSSLTGSFLIMSSYSYSPLITLIAVAVLTLIGIGIQSRIAGT